ncbi:hypothetical protein, partial [Haloarcula marismortui]|uniref:hypothetical protein n=1 Tax=Haloarcula marismortui TaxID=2238 RepID=UPI0019D36F76
MQAEADPCFPYSGGPGKTGGAYCINTNLSTKPEFRCFSTLYSAIIGSVGVDKGYIAIRNSET